MRVSKTEEYGLRLVVDLAVHGGQLSIRELAECEGLPETTVAKVVARLREAGVVHATRGRNGGYVLAASPEETTLATVLAAFDDEVYDISFCERMAPEGQCCVHSDGCGLRPVWRSLTHLIGNFLSGITVADVVRDGGPGPAGERSLPLAAGSGA